MLVQELNLKLNLTFKQIRCITGRLITEAKQGNHLSACHAPIEVQTSKEEPHLQYCPFCGTMLPHHESTVGETLDTATAGSHSQVTLIQGHVPEDEPIQFTIGPYQVLRSIGKGVMGEVFLAYDTSCGRRIALKRIRTDLSNHRMLYNRFLKRRESQPADSPLHHPDLLHTER